MRLAPLFRTIQGLLFNSQPSLITNSFFSGSQLKPRIQMLVNPKTSRRSLWRYGLVLPVVGLLLMCSQKDPTSTNTPVGGRVGTNDIIATTPTPTGEVFTIVEQNPIPQGGMAGLSAYMSNNVRFPVAAQQAKVEGKVFVSFVVAADGRISDVQVLKGLGFGCDEEAVRVVLQMPPWTPGRQNGKPVNVKFNLPIRFSLE